ncbi:ribosome biosynthesis protein nip7, partial [Linnemannia elongata]
IGRNITHLIDRGDETYCFRLHRDRVYYVSESVMRKATSVGRDQLISLGICFGKFTKTGKFRMHVTCLDYIAQYAKGVIVYSMTDVPLGFGVTARSTSDTRKMEPTAIVVFHQADIGEYLRQEDTLF